MEDETKPIGRRGGIDNMAAQNHGVGLRKMTIPVKISPERPVASTQPEAGLLIREKKLQLKAWSEVEVF